MYLHVYMCHELAKQHSYSLHSFISQDEIDLKLCAENIYTSNLINLMLSSYTVQPNCLIC